VGKISFLILISGIIFFGFNSSPILAYYIEDLQLPERGDFVLGPGKIEIWADPGEEFQKELIISNRIGQTMEFKIEIEDFKGSYDPNQTVILLGEERGPHSLKDFLLPEITKFTLKHGQRITLPVKISIPKDAEPGGLYGSVLVSTNPPMPKGEIEKEKAKGQMRIVSRLGCLFFIRVKGETIEEGLFKNFLTKKFYEKGPISFELFFENKGNVHLNPYGIIEIKNLLGRKVGEIEIEPFFALPDSLRKREVKWEKELLFGKYTALASLNRGYQDIIDQKLVEFWVIPYKIILVGLILLILVLWFFKWIISHFEIRRKT
jgi:hypothetical protein